MSTGQIAIIGFEVDCAACTRLFERRLHAAGDYVCLRTWFEDELRAAGWHLGYQRMRPAWLCPNCEDDDGS